MSEEELDGMRLLRIAVDTALVCLCVGSFVGFTWGSLQGYRLQGLLLQYTILFSAVFGCFGAGMVYVRENDHIELPIPIQRFIERKLGIDAENLFRNVWFPGVGRVYA